MEKIKISFTLTAEQATKMIELYTTLADEPVTTEEAPFEITEEPKKTQKAGKVEPEAEQTVVEGTPAEEKKPAKKPAKKVEKKEDDVDIEDLRRILSERAMKGMKAENKALFDKYGFKKLSEANQEQLNAVYREVTA